MTEFDLEKAKAGAPLITRKGRDARIVCYDRVDTLKKGTILALIMNEKKTWERPVFYDKNGRQVDFCVDLDLFLK
jgi:hypothetical protein